MSAYRLTPVAQEDLADIRDYYWEEAGHRVARQMLVEFVEAFRFLARTPGAGHKREDLAEDRPILFWSTRPSPDSLLPGTNRCRHQETRVLVIHRRPRRCWRKGKAPTVFFAMDLLDRESGVHHSLHTRLLRGTRLQFSPQVNDGSL